MKSVKIIGGGLSGCEAAWQLAKRGIAVTIYELRNENRKSKAHKTDVLAELVCSNSFRNDDINSAIGLLHAEMRLLDSLILKAADENKVPAGSALAMDRDGFALQVQNAIKSHPKITIVRDEIDQLPLDDNMWIIATGPLTSDKLSDSIKKFTGEEHLAFFDAIAPIVHLESIDFSKAWFQSRYDKAGPGGGDGKDYINCPMTKVEYEEFVNDLILGEKTEFKEWEKENIAYFEGCLPIEVMAERGIETLRFGPLKPVGLTNPHSVEKQYAVVQLRQDNKLGTLYNIVGFQTKLKYGEQARIFKKIPGLENAEFARFGGIHRNSFINSPKLLDDNLRLKLHQNIRFAGQITGVEGYVESASMGLLAGIFAAQEILEKEILLPPPSTAIGSLLNHITIGHLEDEESSSFQPMNVNFGLFSQLNEKVKKGDRKEAYVKRAIDDVKYWVKNIN